jgi:hypothetical protein
MKKPEQATTDFSHWVSIISTKTKEISEKRKEREKRKETECISAVLLSPLSSPNAANIFHPFPPPITYKRKNNKRKKYVTE